MELLAKNVHGLERGVRVLLGIGLLSLVFIGPQTYWGLIGIVQRVDGH